MLMLLNPVAKLRTERTADILVRSNLPEQSTFARLIYFVHTLLQPRNVAVRSGPQ